MPKTLSILPLVSQEDEPRITRGIQTIIFEDERNRGIPFKNSNGVITKEQSLLFNSFNKPIIDGSGIFYDVFYEPANDRLVKPRNPSDTNYRLLHIQEVSFFKVNPTFGQFIRMTKYKRICDVLLMTRIGAVIQLGYPGNLQYSLVLEDI